MLATCLALGVAAACVRAPSAQALVWGGGFETGNLRQWSAAEALPGGVSLVHNPVRRGSWAARFVVRPGDRPIDSYGERAELINDSHERAGMTSWWAWSTLFPDDFYTPPYSKLNVFAQWHAHHSTLKPNVSFTVINWGAGGPHLQLWVRGGDPASPTELGWNLGDLQRNRWYDFVLQVRWSPDERGFVKLWINGKVAVPLTATPTLYPAGDEYVKQGLYRGPFDAESVVYQDAMRRGTSYASVVGRG